MHFERTIGVPLYGLVLAVVSAQCSGGEAAGEATLLVQGFGPVASSKGAEASWGEWRADMSGKLAWSGFVGYLVRQGWTFGGVLRSKSEQVSVHDLDRQGASDGQGDFYVLASSIPAQEDGLASRARELATAVAAVRKLTGGGSVRLVCYSGGGLAARVWMQGALENCQYESGSVANLVTVATPHFGIGGVVRPLGRVWDRYAAMAPDSALLRRINRELDLPADARYTAVVIQGTGTSFSDTGRAYERYVRLSADQLVSLPPLMRLGHDGVVHCLSAQLHLTPAAARYENRTDWPVEVVFCRLPRFHGADGENLTIHTAAMHDSALWETLGAILQKQVPTKTPRRDDAYWAAQIAQHLAELNVQRQHLLGTIGQTELIDLQPTASGQGVHRFRWKCACMIDTPRMFRGVESRKYLATGSFELSFDRFGRPCRLAHGCVELIRR